MFGLNKKKTTIAAKVLFHKECNGYVEHGVLCAEHKSLNVTKNDAVRFCFEGIEPPLMTPEVLAHIFDQAERKGYIVHHLHSYANVVTLCVKPQLQPRDNQARPVLHDTQSHDMRNAARTPRKPFGDRVTSNNG